MEGPRSTIYKPSSALHTMSESGQGALVASLAKAAQQNKFVLLCVLFSTHIAGL